MRRLHVRRATVEDSAALAGLKVRGWQWGYRGLLPDAFLAQLSVAKSAAGLRAQLGAGDPRHIWIAEADGAALGFITCGPTDDAALPPATGEVFALYQEEHTAGSGVGRALLAHASAELRARGFTRAVLWVLENNQRARRFYERAGWTPDGARKEDRRPDHTRHELRYRAELL